MYIPCISNKAHEHHTGIADQQAALLRFLNSTSVI